MSLDKAQLAEAWSTIEKELVSGNVKPKNEHGEDIMDIREEWTEEEAASPAAGHNPTPAATGCYLPDIDAFEAEEEELGCLFEELEELELNDAQLRRLSKERSKQQGLKRGFLLNSDTKPKSILKQPTPPKTVRAEVARPGVSLEAGPSNSSSTAAPIAAAAPEKRQSTAFTGQVVERGLSEGQTLNTAEQPAPQQERVSRFKQRRGAAA